MKSIRMTGPLTVRKLIRTQEPDLDADLVAKNLVFVTRRLRPRDQVLTEDEAALLQLRDRCESLGNYLTRKFECIAKQLRPVVGEKVRRNGRTYGMPSDASGMRKRSGKWKLICTKCNPSSNFNSVLIRGKPLRKNFKVHVLLLA
jgi:hypothetical protein